MNPPIVRALLLSALVIAIFVPNDLGANRLIGTST